jgi:hypothetical protein
MLRPVVGCLSVARSRVEFEGYVGSGAAMQAYAQILTLLLRLRYADIDIIYIRSYRM